MAHVINLLSGRLGRYPLSGPAWGGRWGGVLELWRPHQPLRRTRADRATLFLPRRLKISSRYARWTSSIAPSVVRKRRGVSGAAPPFLGGLKIVRASRRAPRSSTEACKKKLGCIGDLVIRPRKLTWSK